MRKSFMTALLCVACATSPATSEDVDGRGLRPRVLGGSCVPDQCGGKGTGGCWCDDLCSFYGDCCEDAGEVCGVDECEDGGPACPNGQVCQAGEPHLCVPDGPDCTADDAQGVGLCQAFFGWAWNGQACVGVTGCSCEGSDCGDLAISVEQCETAHAGCAVDCPDPNDPAVDYVSTDPEFCATVKFVCEPGKQPFSNECGCGCEPAPPPQPPMCGGIAAIPCEDPGTFCDVPGHCGAGDQSGTCQPVPQFCTQQYDPVCGCDGVTYGNACTAHAAGVSVAHEGPCEPAPNSCEGHCGGASEDGTCWCDAWCAFYGDCCADKAQACG